MTTKAAFNAEEWATLAAAPALTAMTVVLADRGGTLRESISMARAYAEARRDEGSELVRELVATPPALDPSGLRGPDDATRQASAKLRQAVDLLEEKATSDEVADYKRFVIAVADTVAGAHREGGFLGIGGTDVSDRERAALDEIRTTLGVGASGGPAG
jgi:hypothetical protein